MGLFQQKKQPATKPPIDESTDGVQRFFDGYFSELKVRGRASFDQAVEKNAADFKQDLDATVAKAGAELRDHIAARIDQQIAENDKIIQGAQATALQALTQSVQAMQQQHRQLGEALEKNIAEQQAELNKAFEENKARIVAMQGAQDTALQSLSGTVQAMQEQQRQIVESLQKNIVTQEAVLVHAFEENMAQIIEHYMLEAMGEQFDIKAQLPMIIKQMETNKQAMMDDIKL